jgi:CBS domain-containing protein
MQAREIMTTAVVCCSPEQTAQEAAALMKEEDTGSLIVVEGENRPQVKGIVTDRDLCMAVVANNRKPNEVQVSECMTKQVVTCRLDDDVEEIADMMAEKQIRRIPVTDGNSSIIGVLALADLVRNSGGSAADTLHDIEEPSSEASVPRATQEE